MRWTDADLAAYQSRPDLAKIAAKHGLKPKVATEETEHKAVARYLNLLGVFWLHPANEGKRSPQTGARLKALGLLPGAADFLIFDAPPLHPCAKGVALELKRSKGGRVTDSQREFLDNLERRGWITGVVHGANEAMEFFHKLGWRNK